MGIAAIPILGDLVSGATEIIKKIVPDKDKQNELINGIQKLQIESENEIRKIEHEEIMAQSDINKIEAASNDAYVRRARPTILWICGLGLAYSFLIHPLLCWIIPIVGMIYPEVLTIQTPPNLSMSELFPVLLGMLGLSGYRTYEKVKGVNGK